MRSAAVLAILLAPTIARAADLDYGRYLAGECTTCHLGGGGTPALAGMTQDRITSALAAFKTKEQTNPVMWSIAEGLDADQAAAVALYFASLTPDPNTVRKTEDAQ